MKVAVVTKTTRSGGGASRFAFELADALSDHGCAVTVFTYSARGGDKGFDRIDASSAVGRIQRHLDWRLTRFGCVGLTGWDYQELQRRHLDSFDLVHVHDSYEVISPLLLARLAKRKPVVHTMHDTSSFTGGCINPLGCSRYKASCGHCPQKKVLGRFDFTRTNLAIRRRVYANERIFCVFPSRWIMGEACSSLKLGQRARRIANGFESGGYNYQSRAEARRILGIADTSTVVCVGAHTVASPHKGFGYAVEALRASRSLKPTVVLLGNVTAEARGQLEGLEVLAPGFLTRKDELALYYSASNVMLFPSLGDNLPTMVQESMCAQTPVLAFATGGVPELIDDETNGWLVPRADGRALTNKLGGLLSVPERWSMFGERARSKIERCFSMDECLKRYLELYGELCSV